MSTRFYAVIYAYSPLFSYISYLTLRLHLSRPAVDQSSVYTRPDVTLHGLFNLLGAVENELPSAFSPEEYYRSREPAKSVKKEVLRLVCGFQCKF